MKKDYNLEEIIEMQENIETLAKEFSKANKTYSDALKELEERLKENNITEEDRKHIKDLYLVEYKLEAYMNNSIQNAYSSLESAKNAENQEDYESFRDDVKEEESFGKNVIKKVNTISASFKNLLKNVNISEKLGAVKENADMLFMHLKEIKVKSLVHKLERTESRYRDALEYAHLRSRVIAQDKETLSSFFHDNPKTYAPKFTKVDSYRLNKIEKKSNKILGDIKDEMIHLNEMRIKYNLPEVRTKNYNALSYFKEKTKDWDREFIQISRKLRKDANEISDEAIDMFYTDEEVPEDAKEEINNNAKEIFKKNTVPNEGKANEKNILTENAKNIFYSAQSNNIKDKEPELSETAKSVFGINRTNINKNIYDKTAEKYPRELIKTVSTIKRKISCLVSEYNEFIKNEEENNPEKRQEVLSDIYYRTFNLTKDFLNQGGDYRTLLDIMLQSIPENTDFVKFGENVSLCKSPAAGALSPIIYFASLQHYQECMEEKNFQDIIKTFGDIDDTISRNIMNHKYISDEERQSHISDIKNLMTESKKMNNPYVMDYIDVKLHLSQYKEQRTYATEKKMENITGIRPKDMFFSEQAIRSIFKDAGFKNYYVKRTERLGEEKAHQAFKAISTREKNDMEK